MSVAYDDGAGAGGSNNKARWAGLREDGMIARRRAIGRRIKGVGALKRRLARNKTMDSGEPGP